LTFSELSYHAPRGRIKLHLAASTRKFNMTQGTHTISAAEAADLAARMLPPARNKTAYRIQQGASNPRPIANELLKAIDECRAEGKNEREDPAVFLILHQLCFVLTGHDFAFGGALSSRHGKAYEAVQT